MFSCAFALALLAQQPAGDHLPPLDPQAALQSIQTAPGFKVDLVAAEPMVLDPVAFDWDGSGRLWVVEMADYPMGMDGKGKPGGRVRILEDSDADGRYDRSRVFAEDLNFPTGIITWRDGAVVTAAPEILFLKDSNGDGVADVREVLFSGFTEGNQQLRINGLRWGLDNWIYCAAGGHYRGYASGTKVKSGRTGREIEVGSRDFRFRPDRGELQPTSGPSQFGRNRDDWGRWFGTQNSHPLWHYVLEDRYLRRNPHVATPDPTRQIFTPGNPEVFPVSTPEKRFHSFEHKGHFTSACAGMIYSDTLLFEEGMHAFVCEPFHNLVQHKIVEADGVSFISRRAPGEEKREIFASTDRWCRPVMTRTGPDGALWIADMYRLMIEHPDWLPEEGRAELMPIYRKGEDRGRIYRLFPQERAPREWPKLDRMSSEHLVALLASGNGWLRDKAQQMLLWRQDWRAIAALEKMAGNKAAPIGQLHALWTLDGLRALNAALVEEALRSEHPGLRENGLRLAEQFRDEALIGEAVKLADDPSEPVRLQLACSLGEWKTSGAAQALARLAIRDVKDEFIAAAIISSAVPHLPALEPALASGTEARRRFFEPLLQTAMGTGQTSVVHRMVAPLSREPISAEKLRLYASFLKVGGARGLAIERNEGASSIFTKAQQMLASPSADERLAAASVLARSPEHQDSAAKSLAEMAAAADEAIGRDAANLLAETGLEQAADLLLNDWPSRTPAQRSRMVSLLLRREAWSAKLLRAVEKQEIAPSAIDSLTRAQLRQHRSKEVREAAGRLFEAGSKRAEVIAQFRPALELKGDPARGREVYRSACQSCHKHGSEGVEVGPDLASVASHPPEKLLASIIDPNADVQPGFYSFTAVLRSGEEVHGVIAAETANSLVFKLPNGAAPTVARAEIEALRSGNLSLMPEGLEAGMSHQQMADLIAFLKQAP